MKQRKIAISLAVVGAIAAPFVFETYKFRPIVHVFTPLTVQQKDEFTDYVAKLNYCKEFLAMPWDSSNFPAEGYECIKRRELLRNGGQSDWQYSALQYWTWNVGTSAAVFGVIFGLAYLLPALARRYWRWLNT